MAFFRIWDLWSCGEKNDNTEISIKVHNQRWDTNKLDKDVNNNNDKNKKEINKHFIKVGVQLEMH